MPPVTVKPLHPRPGYPLTLTIPAVVAGPCSYCGELGRLRCSVCHTWYCTQHCQANHWALHRRECVQPPHLVWPDGVRYTGELVVMDKEKVVITKTKTEADEEELTDQEMTSMNTLVQGTVGRARLEQTMQQHEVMDKVDEEKCKTSGQEAAVTKPVGEKIIKTATTMNVAEVKKPVQPVQVSQAKIEQTRQVSSSDGQFMAEILPARQVSSTQPLSLHDLTETDKPLSSPPVTTPVESLTPTYIPAILSSTLPPQCPPSHLSQVLLPLNDDTSPGQFGVRLMKEEDQLKFLMKEMLESPPPVVQGWKMGRRETVAVKVESLWHRAVAVRKLEEQCEVYLLDYGGLVTVGQDMLRPLPAQFGVLPAFNYQVCLAVVGEEEEELMMGVLKSMEYKLGVEFVEEVLGGRWTVKLREIEEEDVGQLVLESDIAVTRDDNVVKTEETVRSITKTPADQTLSNPDPVATLPIPTEASVAVSVPRGVLPIGSDVMAVVCHLDTPSSLYICPITSVDQFTNILTLSQDCPPGKVVPAVGSCCLAQHDDDWYRAEIVELCQDQVTVFLLDYGKTVQATLAMLRPLPEVLVPIDGLVCKVRLKGIKAAGKEWSKDEIDGAGIILDAGNDVTQFHVTVVEVSSMGEVVVIMRDLENNDMASLMIKTGIAVVDEQRVDSAALYYRPGCLAPGVHTVIMLRMVSPMEMYVCSQEMFLLLSTSITMLEEAASKAAHVDQVNVGDPVIACDEGTWYRAMVTKVMEDNLVQVELVDLATRSKLPMDQLRQASPDIVKDEVMAVSCCLDSWVGEDRKVSKEKWENKMSSLMDEYDELEVEVVGQEGEQSRVIIPELEKKLKGESKSVAELLKERLRKK